MLFKNNGNAIKLRVGNLNAFIWKTIKSGEVIDLEENLGLKLKFEVVNNKKKTIPIEINKVKAETKVMDYTPDDKFFKELQKIKGIGNKTAEDIVTWGTKEKLKEYVKKKKDLPLIF